MANIEEKVEELVTKPINDLGYNVYDVTYTKEGKDNYLRIFIDSENGISLDDCEKVNNAITDMLDEANYIKEQYFLEISSPGIERVLRKDWQLKKYINSKVEVKLFKKDENKNKEKYLTYTYVFSRKLVELADKDEKIVAISAAMPSGTGLNRMAERFPDRFFDVGIAEQHAVTFAAGLAVSGMTPVFAVYSSFLQRAYDQLIHDATISRTHIVLGIDRAGVVGEDGEKSKKQV